MQRNHFQLKLRATIYKFNDEMIMKDYNEIEPTFGFERISSYSICHFLDFQMKIAY